MKSLRYILGGDPHTFDDCLDLARNHRPISVTLDLVTDEFAIDMCVICQFIGMYKWLFENRTVCCSEVYGAAHLPAGRRDEESAIAAANARLQRRLEKVAHMGVRVLGIDKRFPQIGFERQGASMAGLGNE